MTWAGLWATGRAGPSSELRPASNPAPPAYRGWLNDWRFYLVLSDCQPVPTRAERSMRTYNVRIGGVAGLFAAIALFDACGIGPKDPLSPPDTRNQVTIAQGVWGNVWLWEGNFMPVRGNGRIRPARTQVFVLQPVRLDSILTMHEVLSRGVKTKLIGQTLSNATGFYQFAIPPGKYTLCVQEDALFYANGFDGDGYILPATVLPDSVTKVQIDITLRAVF